MALFNKQGGPLALGRSPEKDFYKGKEKHSSSLSPGMNFDRSAVSLRLYMENLFALFDLILYIPSTIFQFNRDRSSWVEPVLS